jgi:hypothetical protein
MSNETSSALSSEQDLASIPMALEGATDAIGLGVLRAWGARIAAQGLKAQLDYGLLATDYETIRKVKTRVARAAGPLRCALDQSVRSASAQNASLWGGLPCIILWFGTGGRTKAFFNTVKVVLQAALGYPSLHWCREFCGTDLVLMSGCLLRLEAAGLDQLRAELRAVHLPLIQVPTAVIVAITATRRMPMSTVYSIKAAPSSSLPRRRTRVRAFDMRHS